MFDIGFGIAVIDLGMLLLIIALITFLVDVFLVLLGEYIDNWEQYSEIAFSIGCCALIVAFIYFFNAVVSADYSFVYVTDTVNNDMDFFMRVSAVWSGQAGSYFFWAFLTVIIYLIFRTLFRDYAHERIFWRSFVILALQTAIFTSLTILSDPFGLETEPIIDGIGLNPLLMNIWNLIHPPIIFIGYALCLIPFTIGIARLTVLEEGNIPDFDGKEFLDNFVEFFVSLAWLVLSSGIIIGGYWAYVTLGWGGFWAWDPIETASLIPWLFLTLYYHGKPFHKKSIFLVNYILSMSYISTLFATYLTRSGIVSSVHAFKPSNTLEKFLSGFIPPDTFVMSIILRIIPDEKILFLFIVLITSFLIPHIIGLTRGDLKHLPISLSREDFQVNKHKNTTLKISFITFFIGIYVIILGLLAPVIYDILGYLINLNSIGFNSGITVGSIFYNTVLTIFGGIMLLSQFFCTFYPRLEIKKKFILMLGGMLTGVIFAISRILYSNGFLIQVLGEKNPLLEFLNIFWTTSDKANLVLPLLFLGIVGLIIEFFQVSFSVDKNFIKKTSQIVLHLSFLLILVGALLSANRTLTTELEVQPGEFQISGTSLTIKVTDLDKTVLSSGVHAVEYDTEFFLTSGSRVVGFGISRLALDNVGRFDYEVTIISDLFSDIYIVTAAAYESPISGLFVASRLQIKIIPYINILWAGCFLLHFAIIPLNIGRFISLKRSISREEILNSEEAIIPSPGIETPIIKET